METTVHLENVEFVQPCPMPLRCRRCSSVDAALNRARCGHGFCGRCVSLVRAARFQCPVDSRSVEKKELVLDKEVKDKILQLVVFCLQKKRGCKRTVVLKDLEAHLETCGYVPVACPCGCGLQVSKRELASHLTTTCERRLVTCNFCQDEIVFKDVQDHNGVCNKIPVTCPHCKEQVRREQLPFHETTCTMKPRNCRLCESGCQFKGTSKELECHENDIMCHVEVMSNAIGEFRRSIQGLEQKVTDVVTENARLKEQLQDITPVLTTVKNLDKTVFGVLEKLKKLEIAEQTVEEMNETLTRLKEHMQRMQPAVVQDHNSNSKSPRGLFSHNNSFEEKQKHAAPPTDL